MAINVAMTETDRLAYLENVENSKFSQTISNGSHVSCTRNMNLSMPNLKSRSSKREIYGRLKACKQANLARSVVNVTTASPVQRYAFFLLNCE
jgi:hypothetical protein